MQEEKDVRYIASEDSVTILPETLDRARTTFIDTPLTLKEAMEALQSDVSNAKQCRLNPGFLSVAEIDRSISSMEEVLNNFVPVVQTLIERQLLVEYKEE